MSKRWPRLADNISFFFLMPNELLLYRCSVMLLVKGSMQLQEAKLGHKWNNENGVTFSIFSLQWQCMTLFSVRLKKRTTIGSISFVTCSCNAENVFIVKRQLLALGCILFICIIFPSLFKKRLRLPCHAKEWSEHHLLKIGTCNDILKGLFCCS